MIATDRWIDFAPASNKSYSLFIVTLPDLVYDESTTSEGKGIRRHMKKGIGVICLIGILVSLLFMNTNKAQADSPASGSWTTGTEVTIDLEKSPAPN